MNRAIYKGNEDALTSSIFERLQYLPKELIQHIFSRSLFDPAASLNLNEIESIEYWPNWSAENTSNANRVEPDVFIRTAQQDIIIEAKRLDGNEGYSQSKEQWKNEIQAYYNEYGEDNKDLVFIALGGLHRSKTEALKVEDKNHRIYKCTWKAVLNEIQQVRHDLELSSQYTNTNTALMNILRDIMLCFELFGFSTSLWLERFILPPKIQQQSIDYFAQPWKS